VFLIGLLGLFSKDFHLVGDIFDLRGPGVNSLLHYHLFMLVRVSTCGGVRPVTHPCVLFILLQRLRQVYYLFVVDDVTHALLGLADNLLLVAEVLFRAASLAVGVVSIVHLEAVLAALVDSPPIIRLPLRVKCALQVLRLVSSLMRLIGEAVARVFGVPSRLFLAF